MRETAAGSRHTGVVGEVLDPIGHPTLRVGCAMWAHPPWIGRYLSPARRGAELAEYARWCNAVEGNATFYAVPAASTIARWAELAPGDFRFMFKVPRTVTHDHRLRHGAHAALAEFLRTIDPLGERIGPVQLQLPPSFGPDGLATLRAFVTALPTSHRWVVELRHPAFFDGGPAHRAADALLTEVDVGRVVLDTRPLYAAPASGEAAIDERRTKPKLPIVTGVMGPKPVVRVIGADDVGTTTNGLGAWVDQVVAWLDEGREPYVFAHQPENRDSPALARAFHAIVAARVPELIALPEPPPIAPAGEVAGQDSLF